MIQTLLNIYRQNEWTVAIRPFELNIMGLRAPTFVPNKFDDIMFAWYNNGQKWVMNPYPCTTDPGTYWLSNPMNPKGTAILSQGQWKYKVGLHRGYKAFVQAAPVTVIRDYNRDDKLDFRGTRLDTGWHAINLHRAFRVGKTLVVDRYSAGCQVLADAGDFEELVWLGEEHERRYDSKIMYALADHRKYIKADTTGTLLKIAGVTMGAIAVAGAIYAYGRGLK